MTLQLTNEIIEWCKAEHFSYFYSDTLLLIVSMVFISIAIVCKEIKIPVSDDVERFTENERKLKVASIGFLYAALFLILYFMYKTRIINGY